MDSYNGEKERLVSGSENALKIFVDHVDILKNLISSTCTLDLGVWIQIEDIV